MFMTDEEWLLADIDFEKTKLQDQIKENDNAVSRLSKKVTAMHNNTHVLVNEGLRRSAAIKIVSYESEIAKRLEFGKEMQQELNNMTSMTIAIELDVLRKRMADFNSRIAELDIAEENLDRPLSAQEIDRMAEQLLDSALPNVPEVKVVSTENGTESEQAQLQ